MKTDAEPSSTSGPATTVSFADPPAAVQLDGVPRISASLARRLAPYGDWRQLALLGFAPGGDELLVVTRSASTPQLHAIRGAGSSPVALTHREDPVQSGLWSPREDDPRHVIFPADAGGNEDYQLFRLDAASGREVRLTPGEGRCLSPVFSRDGRRLAYSSNSRNGVDMDVHVCDPLLPESGAMLAPAGGFWHPTDWSPDGSKLLCVEYRSIRDSTIWLVDAATGERQELAPRKGRATASYTSPHFLSDHSILTVTDEGFELCQLVRIDLTTGDHHALPGQPEADVEDFCVSRDGSLVIYVANESGASRLHLFDLARGRSLPAPELPLGVVTGLALTPDGRRAAFSLSTPRRPGDVFVLDISRGQLELWAEGDPGELDLSEMPDPMLIDYPTFDEVQGAPRHIPAFYYPAPAHDHERAPAPVVIQIHGGPESQSRPRFDSRIAMLVMELGCAVLVPNVRGSSGYGKSYVALDDGRLREDSVKDIGALLDWIDDRPELDSSRIAVHGGSYGGYMVLASLFHYPERLAAGVEIVGVTHFVTFLENTRGYRRELRRVEYGDERDPEMRQFLHAISPTTNAHLIRAPLLVMQGANDPRVPESESVQIVDAVRRNGRAVWYLCARNEGHGFYRKENIDFVLALTACFLEEHLLAIPGEE